MAQQVEIDNFGTLNVVDTTDKLAADIAAAADQIQIENTANYTIGEYVCVGALGTESCEMRIVESIIDVHTLKLTIALSLKHDRFEPVTPINGNLIRIYRAPNVDGHVPADDAFIVLTTVGISVTDMITLYTDQDGGNNYWYKSTYFNAATNFETSLADSTVARGGGYDYYCTAYAIRKAAGMVNNQWITDAEIDEKRKEAQDEINAALQGMYAVPFQAPVDSMISGITRLLAAGKLMMDDPGGSGSNSLIYQQGQDKINEARAMLQVIDDRKYIISDITGTSIISPNSQSSKAFPNATTPSLGPDQGGSYRNFRMSDVQGYGDRRY